MNSVLQTLDLTDNYVGDLAQVGNLQNLSCMTSLSFASKHGSNPICDFENYSDAISHYLPQVKTLDGSDSRASVK